MDLDQLRLKTSPELNDTERDFIRQNVDKLTDEDKDAYSDFLQTGEAPAADPNPAPDPSQNPDPATPAVNPNPTPAPAAAEPAQPASPVFKTEEEAREFVRKEMEANEKAKQAAIDAAKTPEEKKYVEENWKPKTWNQGLNVIVKTVKDELRKEAAEQQEKDAVAYWQNQWDQISKEKNIPSLDTNEGKIIHTQIINLMRGYGKKTFAEGYELWEKVNGAITPPAQPATPAANPTTPAQPVGQQPANPSTPAQPAVAAPAGTPPAPNAQQNARKQAANKVGAANAGTEKPTNTTGVKPYASYEEMKKTSSRGILKDLY